MSVSDKLTKNLGSNFSRNVLGHGFRLSSLRSAFLPELVLFFHSVSEWLLSQQPSPTLSKTDSWSHAYELLIPLVRRYPRWWRGHYILGRLALSHPEGSELASNSYQACKLLQRSTSEKVLSDLLLGIIYVRSNLLTKAEEALSRLCADSGILNREEKNCVREELGAVFLHEGKKKEAIAVLREIPEAERSAGAISLLKDLVKL